MHGIKYTRILSKTFFSQRFCGGQMGAETGFLLVTCFSPLSTTAPLFHTFLHLHALPTRPIVGRSLVEFTLGDILQEIGSTAKESTNTNIGYPLPKVAPPSLKAHESLWTEISFYTVFQFTATLSISLQTSVGKQWRHIEV